MLTGLLINSKVIPSCPVCDGIGQKVRQVTVEPQVKPEVEIGQEQYYLCRTAECEVAFCEPVERIWLHFYLCWFEML